MPPPPSGPAGGSPVPPSSAILAALSLLLRARDTAQELQLDPWELAVNLTQLVAVGLGCEDVRHIVAGGLAECTDERRCTRRDRRSFRSAANSNLTARSCFVLSLAGEHLLKKWEGHIASNGDASPPALLKPRWAADRRQLWYREQLVKSFRQRTGNQEIILAAFEEESWPPRIDDPLPKVRGIVPRERLHDTLKRLNRDHVTSLLLFRRDGSGEGVEWEGR